MTKTEFYIGLNDLLKSWGIDEMRRGYNAFIRISYHKYTNPQMKMEKTRKDDLGYKSFHKILASVKARGKYPEYSKFVLGKSNEN